MLLILVVCRGPLVRSWLYQVGMVSADEAKGGEIGVVSSATESYDPSSTSRADDKKEQEKYLNTNTPTWARYFWSPI
jgi:hypothetical protein